MAFTVADRVRVNSVTVGTGAFSLSVSPVPGYQSFSAVGDGNSTYYTAVCGAQWEVGTGTYDQAANTLSRDTIISSSAGGAKIDFNYGRKDIFVSLPASAAITYGTLVGGTGISVASAAGLTTLTGIFIQSGMAAVQRTAQDKSREFFTPQDFGVYDDPLFLSSSNNQYAALQAWLTACETEGKAPFVPSPLRAYSATRLTFNPSSVSSAARILGMYMSNLRISTVDTAGYIQGGTSAATDFHNIALPSVNRRTVDWATNPRTQCGGVVLINHTNCTIFPGRCFGFTSGLQHWSEVRGHAYNQFLGGAFIDNRFDESLICVDEAAGAYMNENKWYGGNCNYSSSSLARTADFTAGIYMGFVTGNSPGHNNNIWNGRNFEMTTSAWVNVGEGIPIYLDGTGGYNRWRDCRIEGHNGPLLHVKGNINGDDNATQGLFNEADFSFVGSSASYLGIREVGGAYGNIVTLPAQANTVEWNSGPLRDKLWSGGPANSVRVAAPFVLRLLNSGTDSREITTASVRPNIFGVSTASASGQVGPGVYIDTSKCKQFDFHAEVLEGYPGRWVFKAYDGNFTPLGATTTDPTYGTQRNLRFPSASLISTAGGSWSQGSDLTTALRMSVSEEVKWLYATKASGTASLVMGSFGFTGYMRRQNAAGVTVYGPSLIFDPLFDGEGDTGKTANALPSTAGTYGFYFRGQKILNNAAASGVVSGWVCSSAGVLAASRANATLYNTKGRILLNSANNAYYVHIPGTSGTGTEPTGTTPNTDYVDGTVTWRYVGPKAVFVPDTNIP